MVVIPLHCSITIHIPDQVKVVQTHELVTD